MIRVFISHKREDTEDAVDVPNVLKRQGVSTYIDALDPYLFQAGDDLGDYFRKILAQCSHLMAVVSENTKLSWWIPFEIGIATEKQYPIATYAIGACGLPSYLKKWPYLRSHSDLITYGKVGRGTKTYILAEGIEKIAASRRGEYSREFHRQLKAVLGQ